MLRLRRSRRAAAVLGAALAAFGCSLAPTAVAKPGQGQGKGASEPATVEAPPAEFFGVVPQENFSQLTDGDFATMARGDVGTARILVRWWQVQQTAAPCTAATRPGAGNSCDWSGLDSAFEKAARHRVGLLPFVYGSPDWIDGNDDLADRPHRIPPIHTAADRLAWQRFLTALVDRYGTGGVFWREHPTLSRGALRAVQIWNEPGSPDYYQPRPDPAGYAQLLDISAQAIRRADRRLRIMTGGFFSYPNLARGGIPVAKYLSRLYRVPGVEADFDLVGLHPYDRKLSGVIKVIQRAHAAMNRAGDGSTQLWITELGWADKGNDPFWSKGTRGQARLLSGAFETLVEKRLRWGIGGVNWFSWQDVDPAQSSPNCPGCPYTGLLKVDGRAKPAWRAFRGFSRNSSGG